MADKIEKKWKMEKGKAGLMPNERMEQLNDGLARSTQPRIRQPTTQIR